MIGFLKAVFIGVAVYYVIGFISRLLAPFFIRMLFRKVSRKFEEQMNRRTQNKYEKKYKTRKKGRTIIEIEEEDEKEKKDYGGDYVDFEELEK